jgi:hypothetical protein
VATATNLKKTYHLLPHAVLAGSRAGISAVAGAHAGTAQQWACAGPGSSYICGRHVCSAGRGGSRAGLEHVSESSLSYAPGAWFNLAD